MARTSRNGAPAASFDALDNIDIDDMFADDGDDLFDGLDIDLDQMGDITNNMEAPPGLEAEMKSEEKTPAPGDDEDELPKRRKTKRKSKAPAHLTDSDDDEPPQKKKRRTTKATTKTTTTKKKSVSKKEKEEIKTETKSKSKVKSMSMPPPLARPAGTPAPSQGQVAAAGQFGGRQKRSHFTLPTSKTDSSKGTKKTKTPKPAPSETNSDKNKSKKVSTHLPAPAKSSPELPATKPPTGFVPPMNQSTFCGLKSSSSLFYPFMPGLPAEPSIKNRKQYPVMDRINSSFMSFINASNPTKPPNGITPANENENICQLMHDTLKDLNPSGGQSSSTAPQPDRNAVVSTAIGSLRQLMSDLEKHKLAGDLFSVCALLKRQYDFLHQNLNNMERWCKENFSDADYLATYGSPESQKNKEGVADSLLAKFKKPLIKVKVKCTGFKEPKLTSALYASLPPDVFGGVAPSSDRDKKSAKKKKGSTVETSLISSSTIPAVAEKESVIRTYSELRPAKRRQLITELIAQTAKELEANYNSKMEAQRQSLERRHGELKKLVEEDEVVVIHTAAMWNYIEKAGYFADYAEESIQDNLRGIWGPELRCSVSKKTVQNRSYVNGRVHDSAKTKTSSSSVQSIYNGLQSLLVEEHSDDDSNNDARSRIDMDEDESLLHDNFDEPMGPLPGGTCLPPDLKIVDLSNLNPDERAYIHLRKVGLMEDQPVTFTARESTEGPEFISSQRRNDVDGGDEKDHYGVLEDVVERMSTDLIELNKRNNARASSLESAARNELVQIRKAKRQAEEEAILNAKWQQLLKKTKEKLKMSKPKTATKDEQVLPW